MQTVPLHPAIVHLPLALALLAPVVLGGLAVALWRGTLGRRGWTVAIAVQGLLVLTGIMALRTGEADEERAEQVVPGAALEAHEERGEQFVLAAGAGLILAGLALAGPHRSRRWVAAGAAASTLVTAGLGLATGQAGGELVYRHGAAAAYARAPGAAPPLAGRHDDDHDD